MRAHKIVKRNLLAYWRTRAASLFLSVLSPVMFLSAMGLGLGSLVQEERAFGGVGYLAFFATGMLAASAMQMASFSATYPIMSKIVWQRNYEAVLATPVTVRDIFLGELGWIGVMLLQLSVPFFGVMALFGVLESSLALMAIPVVVLLGLSCAAAMFAYTAALETDEAFTWLFRFVITPMFLLSGTFFPIDELPSWAQALAQLTPLFHGIEMVRQLTIYEVDASAVWHLGYLVVMLVVSAFVGIRNLERRLVA